MKTMHIILAALIVLVATQRLPVILEQPVVARDLDGVCEHVFTVEEGVEERKDCIILPFVGSHASYPVASMEMRVQEPTEAEIDEARRDYALQNN